jgi:hypothetical protein
MDRNGRSLRWGKSTRPFRKLTIVDQPVECNVLRRGSGDDSESKDRVCELQRWPRSAHLQAQHGDSGILAEIVSRALATQIDWDAIDGLE